MAQNFYKRTYKDALETIIPDVYLDDDLALSGLEDSVVAAVVNSHLHYMRNSSSLLAPSATTNYASIGEVSGIGSFFIKQNQRTNVTARKLELDILEPLGSSLADFTTSSTLHNFLSGNLLPKITLNNDFLAANTASAFATDNSGTHEYLLDKLGWVYILNTSAAEFDPSAYVASALTAKLYNEESFLTVDGIKGLTHYLWKNWGTVSSTNDSLVPLDLYSSTGEWVSGLQTLDKLETIVDMIYSPHFHDRGDTYVKNAVSGYSASSAFLTDRQERGPFHKLIKGIGYSIFDTNEDVWGLETLYDIDNCPEKFLPYVADLIGWKLYGSNVEGWRRQLRGAVTLYKQKGTKVGIANAISTVLPNTTVQASSISEFYESYVPNLIYYLLKTDSSLFDSTSTWTQDKADNYTNGEYDPVDIDVNVRLVIDHLLLKTAIEFPDLFYVKNFKFDTANPEFLFFYRNRTFCMPPWEEEKFYKDCDVTEGLVKFLEHQLICLGVTTDMATEFTSYVLDNTVVGSKDIKFYNNGMLFLTSSLQLPPNKNTLLENYATDKYSYLPLWNGKSSFFDVDVSSGTFDSDFFLTGAFTKTDFFRSLSIIDEFSPAKALARTRVGLTQEESLSSLDFLCPSVRYLILDVPVSGVYSGFQASAVDMRAITGFVGGDYSVTEDLGRSRNDHTNLPVFKREDADSSEDKVHLIGNSEQSTPGTDLGRTNIRRRNYENNLKSEGLYTRTGYNQPGYFNTSTLGSDFEYMPLGLLPTDYEYHPVVSALDLLAVSGYPYSEDVWNSCWSITSNRTLSGIAASSTFESRGTSALVSATCDPYVRRDQTPEFYVLLWEVQDLKFQREAEMIVARNKFLTDQEPHVDAVRSLKAWLWNESTSNMTEFLSTRLGKRYTGIGSPDGLHKMFKDYITYFSTTGVGNTNLTNRLDGGSNILAHAFGPLVYNGMFTVEGSGLNTGVSSTLLAKSIGEEEKFTIAEVSGLNNQTASVSTEFPIEFTEYRNPHILSGVEMIDASDGTATFSLFNLDASNAITGRDNYLVGNTILAMNVSRGIPRISFDLTAYADQNNLLIPEHDFDLTLKGLIGRENDDTLGGGSFGVWIHTGFETDYHNNPTCWTFKPSGQWEQVTVADISGAGGVAYVTQKLSHYLHYDDQYKPELAAACAASEAGKDVLLSVQEADFKERTLNFNTYNAPIKVPLSYYQSYEQVHRGNQTYYIEIFPLNTQDADKFFVIDHISVRDLRQNSRTYFNHTFNFKDYLFSQTPITADFLLLDSSGNLVPNYTPVRADSIGNLTLSSGSKVTFAKSMGSVGIPAKSILYKEVTAYEPKRWVFDTSSSEQLERSHRIYDGIFTYDGSGAFDPSTIILEGKVKGSNIEVQVNNESIQYSPEQVLVALRDFDRLQKGLGAREATISVNDYGVSGGSRLSYRHAPMWSQRGGFTQFETNDNQYSILNFIN